MILMEVSVFYRSASITSKEFGRRFRKSLSVPFLLKQVCSTNVCDFVTAYSTALGCSEKSFLFPLLTCAAACMGTDCHIELSHLWKEPPIIWTLVITPRSLVRMDIAEHLKQELLKVQNEIWVLNLQEDNKDHLKKFMFDLFTLDQLQEMLKLSNGQGLAIYNCIRSLYKCMISPEDTDVMHRLHYGLGWFMDSRSNRSTLSRTRMNIAVISTPSMVQQTLTTSPNFYELFLQCFLTVSAEENHVKFSQLSIAPETEKLREIFIALIKLHSSGPLVYKFSTEAKEKFGQIHDELTEKAKQMVQKNLEDKVFNPALSYLARLSCVLHVLDNVIESINDKIPVSRLTWNTEISAATVWHARELLGHIVEQRHALMEQLSFVSTQKVQRSPFVNLVSGQRTPTSNLQRSPQSYVVTPPNINSHVSPVQTVMQNSMNVMNSPNQPRIISARRNIMTNMNNQQTQFNNLMNQNSNLAVGQNIRFPLIRSANRRGRPAKEIFVNTNVNPQTITNPPNNRSTGLSLPASLSISSVSGETGISPQPVLLSRVPHVSVLDISDNDFLQTHKSSIRKVLVHGVSQITPSRCVQLKLIFDPTAADNAQKYSLSFARSFLKKLEKLGFGICDGAKNGNLRHFVFKKKKFSALSDIQIKRLSELSINEREYNKCFNTASYKAQNGNVVCLE